MKIISNKKNHSTAKCQGKALREVAVGTGPQISFEKTEMMMSDRYNPTKFNDIKFGNSNNVITLNILERLFHLFKLKMKPWCIEPSTWKQLFTTINIFTTPDRYHGYQISPLHYRNML